MANSCYHFPRKSSSSEILERRCTPMKIQGKSALVTGGASGLGAATVRMLAAHGAKVMIGDVNEDLGQHLAQELGAAAAFVKADVTNEEQVRGAVEETVKRHGGLHIAVATAGIGIAGKLIGKKGGPDLQKVARVLQVNLIGTFDVICPAAHAMNANEPD